MNRDPLRDPLRLKIGDALWQHVVRPHLFRKDAEAAHEATIAWLGHMHGLNFPLELLRILYRSPYFEMPISVFGTPWRNPVGIAAGFVKQAEIGAIRALEAMGVGSIEIGTFTPRPQRGNDPPRVWRFPESKAIVNAYGFNSVGAEVGVGRLRYLHEHFKLSIPLGISIGKNWYTPNEDALKDYLRALRYFLPVLRNNMDWVQINISSPNTPGLRQIFDHLDEFLDEFTLQAKDLAQKFGWHTPRFVLKVSPDDMKREEADRITGLAAKYGFAGIEGTNTTIRDDIKMHCGMVGLNGKILHGGISGEPLRELSTRTLAMFTRPTRRNEVDLVGVGGILKGEHAIEKREVGAKAVQIYTGLVYRGPLLIHEILQAWYREDHAHGLR